VAIHLSGPPGGGIPKEYRTGHPSPCSTLLRVGFAEPAESPRPLVRPYRTVSPLPVRCPGALPSAVCFLWHFPAGHPDWPLASTLPFGVPTFLDPFPAGGVTSHQDGPRPPGRLTVPTIVPHTASDHSDRQETRGRRQPAYPRRRPTSLPAVKWHLPGRHRLWETPPHSCGQTGRRGPLSWRRATRFSYGPARIGNH
jgi:hypothetical protein